MSQLCDCLERNAHISAMPSNFFLVKSGGSGFKKQTNHKKLSPCPACWVGYPHGPKCAGSYPLVAEYEWDVPWNSS